MDDDTLTNPYAQVNGYGFALKIAQCHGLSNRFEDGPQISDAHGTHLRNERDNVTAARFSD